jgi:hypothetical protein
MALNFEYYDPVPDEGFHPLSDEQRSQLMLAIQAWAAVDTFIEKLICRLAKAPLSLGQAVTEDLGPDHRLKALRRLALSWRFALRPAEDWSEQRARIDEVSAFARWAAINKGSRNQLVHWHWGRINDAEISGYKHTMKPPAGPPGEPYKFVKVRMLDVEMFTSEINAMSQRMYRIERKLLTLPAWPEKFD